mmetsp:Transcript_5052/g.14883  ORF Transcript_5052/g.14883 Transcript_5052/m.14883 type:complete len:272 (-) Transcript_5052:5093-5908(-)
MRWGPRGAALCRRAAPPLVSPQRRGVPRAGAQAVRARGWCRVLIPPRRDYSLWRLRRRRRERARQPPPVWRPRLVCRGRTSHLVCVGAGGAAAGGLGGRWRRPTSALRIRSARLVHRAGPPGGARAGAVRARAAALAACAPARPRPRPARRRCHRRLGRVFARAGGAHHRVQRRRAGDALARGGSAAGTPAAARGRRACCARAHGARLWPRESRGQRQRARRGLCRGRYAPERHDRRPHGTELRRPGRSSSLRAARSSGRGNPRVRALSGR